MSKRVAVLFATFLAVVLGTARAQAEMRQVPWQELPQRVTGRLIAQEELGIAGCPQDVALRQPSRRVLQYIENTFYGWEEYDLAATPGASYCVVMRQPYDRVLTPAEAQVLLTASSFWVEQALASSEANTLSAGDPFFGTPIPWKGDATPDLSPDRQPDRGVVGWVGPEGPDEPEGEGETDDHAKVGGGLSVQTGGAVIGGKDDRTRVPNTRAFPHQLISYLSFLTTLRGQPAVSRATGFLVGPYVLLTNGHVVWDGEKRALVRNMTIVPGQYESSLGIEQPAGVRSAVRLATNPGWVATGKIQFDYAAAFFDTPFAGISTYMPLAFDVSPAAGSTVHVAGYPGEVSKKETKAQWTHSDKVVGVLGRLLRYKVDTSPGNSGSPVWQVLGGGQVRAIAVHSTGDTTNNGNSGARLVAQNIDLISEWMRWTPQTRNGVNLTINQVDAQKCPLVKAIVSVLGTSGQPVPDLTRANFTLNENGVPQAVDVEQAQVSDSAISVALVLDASGSLSSFDVDNIRDASRRFVDLLGPRDKVAVYHFANGVVLVQDYTSDKARAKAAINALDNRGGAVGDGNATALFDAIIESAQHSTQALGRRALVAMTDGQNNTGTRDPQVPINAARAVGVPVFTIGFGGVDSSVLSNIAVQTGARFFLGGSSADLQAILAAIGRTFAQQYLLSWATDFISGGTQNIEVTVSDGPDFDQESTTYSQSGTTGCPPPTAICDPRIVRPNGGEVWTKGKQQRIDWTTTGPSCGSTVGLAISDGSEIWYLLDTADDGSQPINIDFLPAGPLYSAVVADRATGHTARSDQTFTIAVPANGFTCTKGPETLCLLQGRYQVRVLWRLPQGGGGFAKAVALGDAAGYFWFVDKANAELGVKLVDGRAANAHIWVFSGALTSLDYSIFVTDSKTGDTRVYSSVEGEFRSFADDTAFGPPPEEGVEFGGDAEVLPQTVVRADGSRPSSRWPAEVEQVQGEARFAILSATQPATQKVLWYQGDQLGNVIVSSENRLDAGGTPFNSEGADDFVVPAQKTWLVEGIDVVGAYYGDNVPQGPAQSVNVFVYGDQNGRPGSLLCNQRQLRPRSGLDTGSFEVNLSGSCRLAAGRYWIAVQANQNRTTAGQWGWLERTVQKERASVWRNPGNGYNTGCSDWTRRSTCGAGDEPDFVFRLRGQETASGGGGTCKAGSTTLCLGSKRFKVEVTWKDAKGKVTAAKATSLGDGSGYFSFGGSTLDLLMKVIDGRPVNNRFWVFYGGLSNAEYTLTVTDVSTGNVKTYTNPKGSYTSVGDTSALPGF